MLVIITRRSWFSSRRYSGLKEVLFISLNLISEMNVSVETSI